MHGDFYGDFLGELGALDDFLLRRRGAARFVQPEDPDVRRLMESLAFFAARTRESAAAELRGAIHRLAHGLLDDFVGPQPARVLLQALPSPRLVEPARIPRGSRVRMEAPGGEIGHFTTMRELIVRPMELDRAELQLRGAEEHRVLIRLRSRAPVAGVPEPLSLHIDHLNDYERSRQFFEWLRTHLNRVAIVYGEPPAPTEAGTACGFRFATATADDATLPSETRGTVARIREFLHFPAKALTLDIDLARPPRPWLQAWLCLDLDAWPEGQVVHPELFRLFTVPIENLFSEPAEPIRVDGTRDHHPIRPWRVDDDVAFHSLVEVLHETPAGPEPLLSGHLASGGESCYELDSAGERGDAQLQLRIPDAFLRPRNVLVRARWFQPSFDAAAVGRLEATLHSRHFEGVAFRVMGALVPHRRSPLWRQPDAMLHVLSRRSKRTLSRSDIVKLMTTLGAHPDGHHGEVAGDIRRIDVHDEPASVRGGGGVQHVYDVFVGEVEDERRGPLADYLQCVEQLLCDWSNNPAVIRMHEPGARRRGEAVRARR
ncbi:type VI secretion system baseplate subunit TssF [Nannocystis sp. SCPEA4]|uniref:type VI secretion system baseplate subunit TssF n=1 Tax=Nannocystis sp. SCPEA4 TaxID=2996787 RepID=UPI00227073A3|nr:type VI secretion system baseplate subunit TssF [Nannocystis sp. SCPEA4]MCY1059592.1 type VI secretion system baseplate subunit TssF [Nannocystis sp. SCPEA4]